MRAGPKLSIDELVTKVLTLESQVLEYKAILLQSDVFTQTYRPARFELSDRQRAIEAHWRRWTLGPSPAAQSSSTASPAPPSALLAPIPVTPPAPAAKPRRSGRPADWERTVQEQHREARENEKKAAARIQEIQSSWGIAEDQAKIALWAMTNLHLDEVGLREKIRGLIIEWNLTEDAAYVVVHDEVKARGEISMRMRD